MAPPLALPCSSLAPPLFPPWILPGSSQFILTPPWILPGSSRFILTPPWILPGSSLLLPYSSLDPPWILPGSSLDPSWVLPGSFLAPPLFLPGSSLDPSWVLPCFFPVPVLWRAVDLSGRAEPQRDMSRQVHAHILPLLFVLAVATVLHVTWTHVSRNNYLMKLGSQFWFAPITVPPTTTEPRGLTPIPILHQKDLKKMPQWDFDDQYKTERERQDHTVYNKCDSSLWTKIDSDPELRDTFIPNIRMYVFNGSITMSEWNRLSHFNNPFGFMDFNHQDVMKALNLVPRPRAPLLTPKPGRDCISCAVVGAGGILWRSKKGQEIDSHDYVFRVNVAVTKSFEDDVGNRTDVYVHTAHSITQAGTRKFNNTQAPQDEGIKYVLIPEGMRDFEWLQGLYKHERLTFGSYKGRRPWTLYSDAFNETRFYLLHMDFLRYVRNRFLKSPTLNAGYWAIVRPTNGAFTMFLALHLCDRVDAYGFITENHKQYSNYYYDRGADTHMVFYPNHDYDLERALWRRLHDLGIIRLYLGAPRSNKTM
ncbi:alpha-N-acetylgalactosaminide alpha-2,6-sialyltransferase 2-like [Eucyclogobius newberryi]|uniref:alpha-N-acetylgalactosaminide alpha-2,6-sialyltransferase 2-like n=1 Tax=Eucyclogobius newberryi TaxID=166745 RepID=UPI003B5B8E1C